MPDTQLVVFNPCPCLNIENFNKTSNASWNGYKNVNLLVSIKMKNDLLAF